MYHVWDPDLDALSSKMRSTYGKYVQQARDHGHYYALTEIETNELLKFMPHCMEPSMFFNASKVEPADSCIHVRVYTFGIMISMGYMATFNSVFELRHFPFDTQRLKIDIRLDGQHKSVALARDAVVFERWSLNTSPWTQRSLGLKVTG